MRRELNKAEVEQLFLSAVDGEALSSGQARALDEDPELKTNLDRYLKAVRTLKDAPREKAPDALASVVLRRVRRRRGLMRRVQWNADYRFPVEVIVPIFLASLVALFLMIVS